MSNDYTITAPTFPAAGIALGVGVGVGLVALAMASYDAFSQVMTPAHALASAAVVEFGAVVEALALARARDWRDGMLAGAAVVFSLTVSASYNLTQVQNAGAGVVGDWQLLAIAIGPLGALSFLALNFGRQLRAHEAAREKWAADKQKWLDAQAQRSAAQQAQQAETARFDTLRAQREAAQRAHELDLERLRAQQAATLTPSAVGGGEDKPATPQTPAKKPSTAQQVKEWRDKNPEGTKAQCAAALGIHRSTAGSKANWK